MVQSSRAPTRNAITNVNWLAHLGQTLHLGHGAVDFAGSGVVHAMGGIIALAGAIVIGPRIGKYDSHGKPQALPGHNVPMVVLGTFILAFGWFGFNAGSTLSGMDTRLAVVAVNTMIAGATGAFAAYLYAKAKWGKADPSWMANGMLAGLVAITAPCAFVSAWAAALIGAVAGAVLGSAELVGAIRGLQGITGAVLDPFAAYLLGKMYLRENEVSLARRTLNYARELRALPDLLAQDLNATLISMDQSSSTKKLAVVGRLGK